MTDTSAATDFPLWSDDPSLTDLLSFDAVAVTAADALLDDRLDPVALGLSGPWGSGKTTVLGLVAQSLAARNTDDAKVIVVQTDPWRYDPTTGAKESLIAEVLNRLSEEVAKDETTGGKAKKLLKRLVQRVDWAKAIKLAAKTSLALQIPSFDELTDLVKDSDEDSDEDRPPRGWRAFAASSVSSWHPTNCGTSAALSCSSTILTAVCRRRSSRPLRPSGCFWPYRRCRSSSRPTRTVWPRRSGRGFRSPTGPDRGRRRLDGGAGQALPAQDRADDPAAASTEPLRYAGLSAAAATTESR